LATNQARRVQRQWDYEYECAREDERRVSLANDKSDSSVSFGTEGREPYPHDRNSLIGVSAVTALLIITLAASLYKGQPIYIFGYIMAIVYAVGQVTRKNRPFQELGVKRGFMKDFKKIWPYFGIDAILFQLLPPTLGIAFVIGDYNPVLKDVTSRLAINFGSLSGAYAIGGLLASALILTLMEEVVFRVTIQERISWFIGTPLAIIFATVLFGLIHFVGASGLTPAAVLDVAGVMIDGTFFGIIYAKTNNLAVTWMTHYVADAMGVLFLVVLAAL
jgi:membrane protease YdiL (CAAX protease family)